VKRLSVFRGLEGGSIAVREDLLANARHSESDSEGYRDENHENDNDDHDEDDGDSWERALVMTRDKGKK